jgi:hypothetical protein
MLRSRVAAAQHAGATTLVAEDVLRPPALLLQRHHLDQDRVDACVAPFRTALQSLPMPANAPRYWRLPTGQERAEGGGWRFDSWAEGWSAANTAGERFDGGWRFVPHSDPALTSPLLQLDARRYGAIEIRMAHETAARDAQLFYAGADGRIAEERSVRWELLPTTTPVTYTIDLRDAPGWQGIITRLRLDPVGVGDGGEVRVESIRLVPAGR